MDLHKKQKIIFLGTPEFAAQVLQGLIDSDIFEIIGVVCQPDREVGRRQELTPPPVKQMAIKKGVAVYQPEKIDEEFLVDLKKLEPDCLLVVAYGMIIPKFALDLWDKKWINVHGSLLPKYRGASPIQTSILNGDEVTGVTLMVMDEKVDHGAIVSKLEINISKGEVFSSLSKRLAELSIGLVIDDLPKYLAGQIEAASQDETQASYCKLIKKRDGQIDWSKKAGQIYNMWRAYEQWPGIFAEMKVGSKKVKIKFTQIELTDKLSERVGEFIRQGDELFVGAGDYLIRVLKLQVEGKKEMAVKSFINGYF